MKIYSNNSSHMVCEFLYSDTNIHVRPKWQFVSINLESRSKWYNNNAIKFLGNMACHRQSDQNLHEIKTVNSLDLLYTTQAYCLLEATNVINQPYIITLLCVFYNI